MTIPYFIVILECIVSTNKKKFAVKQYAVLHWQWPHTPRVYCVSRSHHFLLLI